MIIIITIVVEVILFIKSYFAVKMVAILFTYVLIVKLNICHFNKEGWYLQK